MWKFHQCLQFIMLTYLILFSCHGLAQNIINNISNNINNNMNNNTNNNKNNKSNDEKLYTIITMDRNNNNNNNSNIMFNNNNNDNNNNNNNNNTNNEKFSHGRNDNDNNLIEMTIPIPLNNASYHRQVACNIDCDRTDDDSTFTAAISPSVQTDGFNNNDKIHYYDNVDQMTGNRNFIKSIATTTENVRNRQHIQQQHSVKNITMISLTANTIATNMSTITVATTIPTTIKEKPLTMIGSANKTIPKYWPISEILLTNNNNNNVNSINSVNTTNNSAKDLIFIEWNEQKSQESLSSSSSSVGTATSSSAAAIRKQSLEMITSLNDNDSLIVSYDPFTATNDFNNNDNDNAYDIRKDYKGSRETTATTPNAIATATATITVTATATATAAATDTMPSLHNTMDPWYDSDSDVTVAIHDNHNSKFNEQFDLTELTDLFATLPVEQIQLLAKYYYRNDANVQHAYNFICTEEFQQYLQYNLTGAAAIRDLFHYLNDSSGIDLLKLLQDFQYFVQINCENNETAITFLNDQLELITTISTDSFDIDHSTVSMRTVTPEQLNGVLGLLKSVLKILPQDELLAFLLQKIETDKKYTQLLENLSNPEFEKILHTLQSSLELHNFIFMLEQNGINVFKIVDILKSYFILGTF